MSLENIPTTTVRTVVELVDELGNCNCDNGNWAFRGVPNSNFDLVPSVGRTSVRPKYSKSSEKVIFNHFKREAVAHVSVPSTDMEWLALARHHGLPTRLLDWTTSPLVALFFAAWREAPASKHSFAIYAWDADWYNIGNSVKNPFALQKDFVAVTTPSYFSRVSAQKGFFTCHKDPEKPFRHETLMRFLFPADNRKQVLFDLNFYGINESSLFPGLDGIGAYWSWYYSICE